MKEVNESIERGRAKHNELYNKLSEIVENKNTQDFSYNNFREISRVTNNSKLSCTKSEFLASSPDRKRKMISEMVANMLVENASKILNQ